MLTGSYASLIAPYCRKKIHLDENLQLDGLRLLYEKNQPKKKKKIILKIELVLTELTLTFRLEYRILPLYRKGSWHRIVCVSCGVSTGFLLEKPRWIEMARLL